MAGAGASSLVLEVENLAAARGLRVLFEGLSFSLSAGESVELRGANGSGKSTLLRILAGLTRQHAGDVRYSGAGDEPGRHFLGHLDAVKPSETAIEQARFWARYFGRPVAEADAAMKRVGLSSRNAVPGRGAKRILRMTNAQLEGTYDPAFGYYYWSGGRSASWTLSDLAPGSYRLVLRYSCDAKTGGGKLSARFGGGKIELEVPSTGGWNRRRELVIGPFEITGSRADLILEPGKLSASASYLMDLNALLVQPIAPPAGSAKP